jgi:hypothetical protein
MDMTKFDHPQNAGYQAVSNELWRWVKAIRSRVPVSNAEASGQTLAEQARQKWSTELPESGYRVYQGGNLIQGQNVSGGGKVTLQILAG